MTDRDLLDRYFAAMRRGAEAEEELVDLFTEDAVYVEPFTDAAEPAVGKEAVRERLRRGWEYPLPELELEVLTLDIDGSNASARWECRSPALEQPVRGEDRYEIRQGKICRLEVRLLIED